MARKRGRASTIAPSVRDTRLRLSASNIQMMVRKGESSSSTRSYSKSLSSMPPRSVPQSRQLSRQSSSSSVASDDVGHTAMYASSRPLSREQAEGLLRAEVLTTPLDLLLHAAGGSNGSQVAAPLPRMHRQTSPGGAELSHVPLYFRTTGEYLSVWKPLIAQEARASISDSVSTLVRRTSSDGKRAPSVAPLGLTLRNAVGASNVVSKGT